MSSISAMPAVPQYLSIVKDEQASVDRWEKMNLEPRRAVAAFQAAAPGITTPDQLLKNYKALTVVLGAYNMPSAINQTAVLKQLMTQDPTDKTSLAARSGNRAWQGFAKAFSDWSTPPLASSDVMGKVVKNYLTNGFENSVQEETPGLGDALYFTRTATSDMTLSNIMSDPKLLKVAEVVNGFDPKQFGALDYNQQVRLLGGKMDMKRLSTPAGIQKFAEQYLGMLQIHPIQTSKPATMLSLYGSNGASDGILSLFTGGSTDSGAPLSLYSALM